MSWPDIAILIIIAISALISVFRGFVSEVLSLAAWVVSFWVAFTFADRVAPLFDSVVSAQSMQTLIGFVVLLVVTLMLLGLVNFLIGKLIESTGLSGTDRALGTIFGVVRGIAIVGILVFLAGATPLPQDDWWNNSMFIGHFERLAEFSMQYLPENVRSHFSY